MCPNCNFYTLFIFFRVFRKFWKIFVIINIRLCFFFISFYILYIFMFIPPFRWIHQNGGFFIFCYIYSRNINKLDKLKYLLNEI